MEWIKSIDEAIKIIDRKIDANKKMLNSYNLCNDVENRKACERSYRIKELEDKKSLLEFANGDKEFYPTWI